MQKSSFRVNEIFYSLQGEGIRAGSPSVFVRFSGCNQTCRVETHGFDCDTEFVSGRDLGLEELIQSIKRIAGPCRWVILTGGEPGLQVTPNLVNGLKFEGFECAIETNGSIDVTMLGLDWITVSPKVAEHAIRQMTAHEVKYVRGLGQGIPKPVIRADHYLISPAFNGQDLDRETLNHCIQLCKENPPWRLSIQYHKLWNVR